jgi:UPF0755 protein
VVKKPARINVIDAMKQRNTNNPLLIITLIGIAFLTLVGAGILGAFIWLQKPVDSNRAQPKPFLITKGQSIASIGSQLAQDGLIRSPLLFKFIVWKEGLANKIQAGRYEISPNSSTLEIATQLQKGKLDEFWVTILEGWRREEVAQAFAKAFSEQGLAFDRDLFLTNTKSLEGKLFPDTYLIPIDANEALVISLLTNTFEKKIALLEKSFASSSRTPEEILIMASLIEREARIDSSRQMVSGILWKRLDNAWPLQVDATLQYAKGTQNDWWPEPLAVDKNLNSPYNTYQNTGLPPAPIANPSLSSIQAALNPKDSEYWYYISDLQGNMHYGVTLDDHNANVDQYLR